MNAELHYFRCWNCKTVKVVTFKSSRKERCTCRSIMVFLFSVPIETDEQRAIAKRGLVYNPHTSTGVPWSCVRCGTATTERPVYRVDGKCCQACYQAEEHPPVTLLTPEQIADRAAAKAAFRRQQDDAHEHAYQLAEQEQR